MTSCNCKQNDHNYKKITIIFFSQLTPDASWNIKFSHALEIIGKGHDKKNGKHFDSISSRKSKVKRPTMSFYKMNTVSKDHMFTTILVYVSNTVNQVFSTCRETCKYDLLVFLHSMHPTDPHKCTLS